MDKIKEYQGIFTDNIIRYEDVDADGNWHLHGTLGKVYVGLEINGCVAKVNTETREFKVIIPVVNGKNTINVTYKKNENEGKTKQHIMYYAAPVVNINNMNSESDIIKTSETVYKLSGCIDSYVNISNISVNGDVFYSPYVTQCLNSNNIIKTDFEYNISLQRGVNIILLEAKTVVGETITKEIKIECVE